MVNFVDLEPHCLRFGRVPQSADTEVNNKSTSSGEDALKGYRDWEYSRVVTGDGTAHGKHDRVVYANSIVAEYLESFSADTVTATALTYPEGSIIAKDRFREDGTLEYVVIMRKGKAADIPDSAVAYGGWYWSSRTTPDATDSYQTAFCYGCHEAADEEIARDGVFAFPDCRSSACGTDIPPLED